MEVRTDVAKVYTTKVKLTPAEFKSLNDTIFLLDTLFHMDYGNTEEKEVIEKTRASLVDFKLRMVIRED